MNTQEAKQILIAEMKNVFGDDTRRINHALDVLSNAEKIHASEGGDGLIVVAAAVLHDIGIHEAERKYNSSAGNYQEIEGPPIAEAILTKLDFDAERMDHIIKIVASHHSAKLIDTTEFRIIWDADWIVNMRDEYVSKSRDEISGLIGKVFKTDAGKRLARNVLL